jgi:hypothetical protein
MLPLKQGHELFANCRWSLSGPKGDKMEHYIPYKKLSKKKRQEMDKRKRVTWGTLNPVTRKPPNPKAYDRKKARSLSDDPL